MNFDGATFDPSRDASRLSAQLDAVRELMLDGCWRTLGEIRDALNLPPDAAVGTRVRDLRKPQFGGYIVDPQYVSRGVWRYRVRPRPIPSLLEQMEAGR